MSSVAWRSLPIKKTVKKISTVEKKVKQKEILPEGVFPVIDQGQSFIAGYYNDPSKVVDVGSVIVFGDHTRAIKFVDFPFVPGADGTKVLQPDTALFVPKLFYYFLHCIKFPNKGYARHYQHLEKEHINIPPLEEQEKLVAKIEELFSDIDNGIDRLRRAGLVAEAHYQSTLKMLLLGGASSQISSSTLDELQVSIDKETPIKHKNITIDKGFDLPDLNNGWRWTTLGRVVKSVSYGSSRKSLSEGKIPVIRMGNLQNGEIEWGDLKFSSNSEEINKYLLSPGDVLFNRTNSPELVGKAALYKGERDAIYAGYLIKIEVARAISPEYLNYFLQSSIAKHYGNLMKTDGVNQSNINSQKLLSYPFPLTTRVEQDRIVELLDTVKTNTDAIRSDIEIRIEQALRLKQSILAKAFKGELV